MLGIESFTGATGAALLIGVVLLEALFLYVGYGALERVFGPAIARVLRGE
jgi:hypothetical protein